MNNHFSKAGARFKTVFFNTRMDLSKWTHTLVIPGYEQLGPTGAGEWGMREEDQIRSGIGLG